MNYLFAFCVDVDERLKEVRSVCVHEAFMDGLLMVNGGEMLGAKEASAEGN